MNRNELIYAANGWLEQAKQDINGKINKLMDDMDVTVGELASAIAVDKDELSDILYNDDFELTMDTFVKVLIASDHILEIKPISETPMANGFNHMPPPPPQGFFDRIQRMEAPQAPQRTAPQEEVRHETHAAQPRDSRGRFMSRNPQHTNTEAQSEVSDTNTPNFRGMDKNELVDIIENKLWDSEIDTNASSKEDLVDFLENKDKQLKELKNRRERQRIENDPQVIELKEKIKKTLEDNPNLKSIFETLFK